MRLPKLISEDEIKTRIREMADTIKKDYAGKEPVFVGILNGCFPFISDLIRNVDLVCSIDFMRLRSYGAATVTSGVVEITADLAHPIVGKDVVVVEDIVDTGLTMSYLTENLRTRKPSSVKICSLLDKPVRRIVEVKVDYVGFTIPNHFVVGFGLDFDEKYRNLPYIAVYEDERPAM